MKERHLPDNNKIGEITTATTIQRATGNQAKYFSNELLGYVYPLFKTHKLQPEEIENCRIEEIPIRLVQSVGHSFLSRITSMLNIILSPISSIYCKTGINEFCKDSKDYTDEIYKGKKRKQKKTSIVI